MILYLRAVPDNRVAMRYLEEQLDQGLSLSARVRSALTVWKGRAFLLVPLQSSALPRDYHYGGVCLSGDARAALTGILLSESLLHRKSLILEHRLAKRGDHFISKVKSNPACHDGDVYFTVNENVASGALIKQSIIDADTAHGLTGFVVPRKSLVVEKGEIRKIGQLSRSVDSIIVSVFDGETFMIWQRDARKS